MVNPLIMARPEHKKTWVMKKLSNEKDNMTFIPKGSWLTAAHLPRHITDLTAGAPACPPPRHSTRTRSPPRRCPSTLTPVVVGRSKWCLDEGPNQPGPCRLGSVAEFQGGHPGTDAEDNGQHEGQLLGALPIPTPSSPALSPRCPSR